MRPLNAPPEQNEWRLGWRIAASGAVANATGIALMFYTFSMFLLPMARELGLSRGETGMVQALIVTAALGAPLIGRLTDRHGFHRMFFIATTAFAAVEVAQAKLVHGLVMLAITVALAGLIGGGASSVLLTRPVNAHFNRFRGLALGIVGAGSSISTFFVPPLLQGVIDTYGWRNGFLSLAFIAFAIGMPLVLLLMPRDAAMNKSAPLITSGSSASDRTFFRNPAFWLLVVGNMLASIALSGAISQLSPMIQDEGLSASTAALGLSAFALGQFIGKLGGGWLLDKLEPRLVAIALNILPTAGFVILLMDAKMTAAVLTAAALLGLLQGADVGIFAYFVARRFGVANYGAIFGALQGFGWIGTALGAALFGLSFDYFGNYAPIQAISIGLLGLGALTFAPIRLDRLDHQD